MDYSNSKLSKRARKVLSIKDKIALIHDYNKNIPIKLLSDKYGVGKQTIRDLVKNKEKILLYGSKSDSGEMITEKAKFFHAILNNNSECRYSSGWLEKFKKRHGIRGLKSTGEKQCADYVSAEIQSDIEIPAGCSADDISEWMECDIGVVPFPILYDNEIVCMINQAQESDHSSSSEDEGTEVETPTLAQAIEASNVLLKFVENSPTIAEPDKIQMYRIQNQLIKEQLKAKRQSTLKEYFK